MRYPVSPIALVFISFMLTSCGVTRDAPAQPPPGGAEMGQKQLPSAQSAAVPTDLLERTKADAAQRAGKESAQVEVVSAEAVTWRDASLGCPEPGMMSAQVLTPGYRIRLRVGSEEFNYHAGKGGRFVLCPAERAQSPARSGGQS